MLLAVIVNPLSKIVDIANIMDRKLVHCTVRSPLLVGVSNGSSDFHSGCTVIEVLFPKVSSVDIEEINFKNYCTAMLTVLARLRPSAANNDTNGLQSEWYICVRSKTLMPFPNCEQASEDYFTIKSSECLVALHGVIELRFVLQQPSPVWKEFKIEEIQITRAPLVIIEKPELVRWLSDLDKEKSSNADQQLKGISSIVDISKRLQHMWALTENVQIAVANMASINRYDVDGCYDVTLLSYN